MDRELVADRERSFPSPHRPSASVESTDRPRAAPAYSLSAQRHTLSRLQSFFASHRFDTEGPYDDLFVVLLSTARHLVDICDAQAAQLAEHARALAVMQESRGARHSPTIVNVEDVEEATTHDGRLSALEQRVDRLAQQVVRVETRHGTDRALLRAASPDSAAISGEAVYDRAAHGWELSERLDSLTAEQKRLDSGLSRDVRECAALVRRLQDDQRAQQVWCTEHVTDLKCRLDSLETRDTVPGKGRKPKEEPFPTSRLTAAAQVIATWREGSNAHPLLHNAVLARLFGDDAAAVAFTESVRDRLDGLEAVARDGETVQVRTKAALGDMRRDQVAHAQLVEGRLENVDRAVEALDVKLARLTTAVGELSESHRAALARRDQEFDSDEGEDHMTNDADYYSRDWGVRAAHDSQATLASVHAPPSHPYNAAPVSTRSDAHHHTPHKNAPGQSRHATALSFSPTPVRHSPARSECSVTAANSNDVVVTWRGLTEWVARAATTHAASSAAATADVSRNTTAQRTEADVALQNLVSAVIASQLAKAPVPQTLPSAASSSSSSNSVSADEVEALATTLATLSDDVNTFSGRLAVLEAYSPHVYAVSARPPMLGVELEDVQTHPEEQTASPECLGAHTAGGGGVRVVRVFPGYPASFAGFAAGDVVVAVQGHVIRHRAELFACLTTLATEHRARCQVRIEDAFLHGQTAPKADRTPDKMTSTAARRLASQLARANGTTRAKGSNDAPAEDAEAWRAWQLEALLPRQELLFTLWRQGQFVDICLLVPPSAVVDAAGESTSAP